MLEGSVNAWLNDTQEVLEIGRRLGEGVVVIGVSTGGTAATCLTAQPDKEDMAAVSSSHLTLRTSTRQPLS